ncbi:MAG TPA: hypothetical protein VIT00_11880 [Terrimicrobiaceae bacterium]
MTAEPLRALQIFGPDPGKTYTIEAAANITQVPRRLIAVYCKLHMVSPIAGSEQGALHFNRQSHPGAPADRSIEISPWNQP